MLSQTTPCLSKVSVWERTSHCYAWVLLYCWVSCGPRLGRSRDVCEPWLPRFLYLSFIQWNPWGKFRGFPLVVTYVNTPKFVYGFSSCTFLPSQHYNHQPHDIVVVLMSLDTYHMFGCSAKHKLGGRILRWFLGHKWHISCCTNKFEGFDFIKEDDYFKFIPNTTKQALGH